MSLRDTQGILATPIPSRVYLITRGHPRVGGTFATLLCATSAHSASLRYLYSSLAFGFQLLALFTLSHEGSVVEGSTASPERSRRVNCFHPNSHRITSFAHPHPLTPIESNSCKKQGGGVPLTPNLGRRASSPCATRRNSRNSIPFIALLHNLRTPPGGGSILSTHPDACRPISANPFRIHAYKKQGGLLLIYRQCSPLQLPIGP